LEPGIFGALLSKSPGDCNGRPFIMRKMTRTRAAAHVKTKKIQSLDDGI
jgi:hypothetical protein